MLTKEDLALFDELMKKNFETERVHTARLIVESEKRTEKKIEESEERLRSEIVAARTEAKEDSLRILGKLDKQNARIENLEKATGTPNPHKN